MKCIKVNKNAISPVVATALLIVIAVVSVVGFQTWFGDFSSGIFSDTETQSKNTVGTTQIENLIGTSLYFNNAGTENITVTEVKIDGVDCNIATNATIGISEFDISSCLANVTTTIPEVVVYTNNRIYSEKFYVKTPVVVSNSTPISSPSNIFISQWNTSATSAGSSNATQIKLPLEASGTYNFIVYWGDGTNDTVTLWNGIGTNHTYASAGIYQINITGQIIGFNFNGGGDRLKINLIENWGVLNLGNSGWYFDGCNNLNSVATDSLNLTGTTNLMYIFSDNHNFNGNISGWDVSEVTNMEGVFWRAFIFNQDLSSWDVSNVTTMNSMFGTALNFNQNISNWNVHNVTDMDYMFYSATSFNQSLNGWNVSKVISMNNMFADASSFNGDISGWDVSSVTNMNAMFFQTPFNQPLNSWNVSNVTNMRMLFIAAHSFNQNISNWDVSRVITMESMFQEATNFNQNISNWNVSSVTDMRFIFASATNFNQSLSSWDVDQVTICLAFNNSATTWTTAKPNFTSCTP